MNKRVVILTTGTGIPTEDGLEELNTQMDDERTMLKVTSVDGHKILINKRHILFIDKMKEASQQKPPAKIFGPGEIFSPNKRIN